MSICTFFGHHDCPQTILPKLEQVLRDLIRSGVTQFYLGNHGRFDAIAAAVLRKLRTEFSEIRVTIVLAYLPKEPIRDFETVYPEGLESVPPRFAIIKRNRWMLDRADLLVTYITHPWGNAAALSERAQKQNKRVINLPDIT